MAGETPVYTILGYEKDGDVYVRLANVYHGLDTATRIRRLYVYHEFKNKI